MEYEFDIEKNNDALNQNDFNMYKFLIQTINKNHSQSCTGNDEDLGSEILVSFESRVC